MNAPHADNVPTAVRYLAELFADALGDVKFPDVDANALAATVSKVDALTADAVRLEEELVRAKQAADVARDDLLRLAARAHAYARVFAEDDDALRSRLDAITLPRARPRANASTSNAATTGDSASATSTTTTTATTTSTRRKKKAASDEESPLFGDAPSAEAVAPPQAAE